MFHFSSVICTRCTGFFCLATIKGPPNDTYCIIEEPSKYYFTEKTSRSDIFRKTMYTGYGDIDLYQVVFSCIINTHHNNAAVLFCLRWV